MLVRRITLDELGGLDERMGIGTFEDDDFCLRLVVNGYHLLIALDAFIHHIGNVSFIAAGGYPDVGDHNQRIVSKTFCLTVPEETMLIEHLVERIKPSAKRIAHAECGVGAYGLYAQAEGRYAIGLESSGNKYALMKNNYNVAIQYQPGEDFDFPYAGFDAFMIEKQNNDQYTLSLIRSVKPALIQGAQVILQVPKIIAINPENGEFIAYKEAWSESGCTPSYGRFSASGFIDEMRLLGLKPVSEEMDEPRMGYFNRCAFSRHSSNHTDFPGQLSTFKEWTAEFVYGG
jgi:hypothetical protein